MKELLQVVIFTMPFWGIMALIVVLDIWCKIEKKIEMKRGK